MAVTIAKTPEEIRELPLVELAWEILRTTREPYYFRDLMKEIQELRGMSDEEVMDVIARLYTEINIDGRFVCIGRNVWGLKRWYSTEKTDERSQTSKRFVRASGDAFSDDDDLDEYEEDVDEAELDGIVEEGLDEEAKPDEEFDGDITEEEEELPFVDEEEPEEDLLGDELAEEEPEDTDEEDEY
ncbi:DNA-directed RNA polymerase subunit delta [Alicyclobacillus macrosporangiidus]|uniref:Probable DNA-directed RNA polymerase subunit delta n=1 Tax=Alicyclobacillus macrosporangiidus TaxID=392015 RepID=A0A1I7HSX6_9BACL|nr:DNA-directed RNA polymerase subunit delta [Alicyclobacillus macrosporangiidus]SFU63787.1 DNA-directed RNA polymerase subunit delta [Alicyclobacillus macrosporangiidus]